jgi:hypothetical protein
MMMSLVLIQISYGQFNPDALARALLGDDMREDVQTPYYELSCSEKVLRVTKMFTHERRDLKLNLTHDYEAPKETTIVSATFKANDPNKILVVLSGGKIVILDIISPNLFSDFELSEHTKTPNVNLSGAQKIAGDAVYVLKQGTIYASQDTAKTWAIDTLNIGTQYVQDVTVDTNFYAWVITQSRNLYYQHPDSIVWHKDTSFTTTGFPQAIFVDRKGRMFISTTASASRVWMSTNSGSSWANTSTGIAETITKFGDDAFGNIYAVGSGSHAYRLSNLTPPWESIGDSIAAQAYLPSNAKIINSISGDTILFAATRYGMFLSTDFGASWEHSPDPLQLPAHKFYTGVVKAGKYYFLSTNLGIYRVAIGDTTSEKVWPKQGYIWGVNNLSSDSAGNIYSNLPFKTGPSTSIFYNVKSTDKGNTWLADTAGEGALGLSAGTQAMNFSVDRQGTQFLVAAGKLYTKRPGQPWKMDTTGIGLKPGEIINDISTNNKKGIIYARRTYFTTSLKFAIYKRAIADTAWQIVDTSPLAINDGNMVSDQNGGIFVKTFANPYKIWRYDGSTWTAATPTAPPLFFTVDRNGVLWGWGSLLSGSNKGVSFSTDNGSNWTYAGLNGVGVNFLTAVEDSTTSALMKHSGHSSPTVYAVTFIDGIYGFSTDTTTTSVRDSKPEIIASYELYQNYPNPFNPSTTIKFTTPERGRLALKIFDILGREVATLVNGDLEAGSHQATFDASKLSSGIYFYRLQAERFVSVKKMLLLK